MGRERNKQINHDIIITPHPSITTFYHILIFLLWCKCPDAKNIFLSFHMRGLCLIVVFLYIFLVWKPKNEFHREIIGTVLYGHTGAIIGLLWLSHVEPALCCSWAQDGKIKIWDLFSTQHTQQRYQNNQQKHWRSSSTTVAASNMSSQAETASYRSNASIATGPINYCSRECIQTLSVECGSVISVVVIGSYLLSCSQQGNIYIWKNNHDRNIMLYPFYQLHQIITYHQIHTHLQQKSAATTKNDITIDPYSNIQHKTSVSDEKQQVQSDIATMLHDTNIFPSVFHTTALDEPAAIFSPSHPSSSHNDIIGCSSCITVTCFNSMCRAEQDYIYIGDDTGRIYTFTHTKQFKQDAPFNLQLCNSITHIHIHINKYLLLCSSGIWLQAARHFQTRSCAHLTNPYCLNLIYTCV